MQQEKKIKVLIAKVGLDGHDRGAKIVARVLMEAGMEVIYSGLHQTPEQIISIAIQEDVDAIGVSILSGAHNQIFSDIKRLIKKNKLDDILLFVGGIIPQEDFNALYKKGVKAIFGSGTPTSEIVEFLRQNVQ